MKYILVIICSLFFITAKSQFTGTDSLRNYNNKYITSNPATAFTNLRLNTLLRGIIDWVDTARAGTGGGGALGVDTLWALNDSTIRYRKNGVFRNVVVKGVYDNRRKVDTMYKVNDTTIGFTINHVAKTLVFPSGSSRNISNAALTANGNYIQDWAQHWFYLNNLQSFTITGNSPDPNLPLNNKVFNFFIDSTYNNVPMQLVWGLKDQSNSFTDSLHFEINSTKDYTYLTHWVAKQQKYVELDLMPALTRPTIQMLLGDASKFGQYQFASDVVYLIPNDSIQIKAVPATTAPKILGFRAISGDVGTVVYMDAPTGGSADSSIFATKYGLDTAKVNLRTDIAGKQPAGNYITALTGPVTASGPGSAATSITNNAITDAMLRQSAGLSVIGRSGNSTGNAADITASSDNQVLRRSGTSMDFGAVNLASSDAVTGNLPVTNLNSGTNATSATIWHGNGTWDSLDYAHVKNKPDLQNPGIYFSPAEAFDPSFVVFASMIPRVTSTFTHGQPILYEILGNATEHNSSFYDSVYGDPVTERLAVRFPPVRNVLNSKVNVDETLAQNGVFVGPSVATNGFLAPVYQIRSAGIRLNGDGAGNWTTNALFNTPSSFSASVFNTSDGGTSFDWGFTGYDPDQIGIQYIGPNNYHIKRVYSGLGIYTVRFILLDEFGNPVTSNPATTDEILITNAGMQSRQIPMATYSNGANNFMTGFANFWIDGSFECWLVAAPTSSASILVRWQTIYPSATNYKIYRATSLYGSRTLIHTGTDGSFVDTGLSSGTLYWYFMIAVIGGIDTDITYFRTSTKN